MVVENFEARLVTLGIYLEFSKARFASFARLVINFKTTIFECVLHNHSVLLIDAF